MSCGKEYHAMVRGRKNVSNIKPRLFIAMIGDISTEPFSRVKYGFFIKALEKRFSIVICDATLRGFPRFITALSAFQPNKKLWKERFYQNSLAFKMRSKKVATQLLKNATQVDVILQIGVLLDAHWTSKHIPSIIYTDYTTRLSSQKPELGRSPQKGKELARLYDLEKKAFFRSNHICTRGKFLCESIAQDYAVPADWITPIGGGLNFDSLPLLQERTDFSHPTALFIGKDFYRKGGDLLLDAFKNVRVLLPDARLIMVTEGMPVNKFDLTGVEIIKPTWDREMIKVLYLKADCFVLPSRLETWGDVFLEAMAYGLPCIGVNGDAMNEIIRDHKTGLIIPPGDVNSLSDALVFILSNREQRTKYGIAARLEVENHFTWDHVVSRLYPIIESSIHP